MYLILSEALPDGHYWTVGKLKWHEKLRLTLCKKLYMSVKKPESWQITTTSGTATPLSEVSNATK